MMKQSVVAALVALALVGCGVETVESSSEPVASSESALVSPDTKPEGRAGGLAHQFAGSRKTSGAGISYHGGPVMTGTVNAYVIWYGNWTGHAAVPVLTDLLKSIGGSPYYNINTTYTNGSGGRVANAVAYAGSTTDNYSLGKSLTDAQIQTVVANAIASNALPKDTNGIYFVVTAADVTASSGFCSKYCGWHTHGTIAGADIKYSFIGNPETQCPTSCSNAAVTDATPNGTFAGDAMASIIAHELEETTSDPDLNAWYDSRGYENADKCAWTFGTTYTTASGAVANMKLGTRDFLIQQNWVNAGTGSCALSY